MRILVVDDNKDSLRSLSMVLEDQGHQAAPAESALQALQMLEREYFPLIITDIRMPGMDGLELLGKLKKDERLSQADVVIVTGHGDMETAIDALRKGAYDYLNKPINVRELSAVVRRSAERQALLLENLDWRNRFQTKVEEVTQELQKDLDTARDQLRQAAGVGDIVAASAQMQQLIRETRIYHQDPDVPVLIEGETGVGKEILARLIHFGPGGCEEPFVPINCSAIPENLFESELFGHDPGAFTGSARKGVRGKLELAGKGTLFLDEVAELPYSLQPKLLRVLEDRAYYRVGGVKQLHFLARVVCAANQDLGRMVEDGRFRRDLYHRIKVGQLIIPPLRDRPEDIPALAIRFLQREAHKKKKAFTSIHPEAMQLLQSYSWEGNVRELENAIERAVLIADGSELLPSHLDFLVKGRSARPFTPMRFNEPQTFSLETMELPDEPLILNDLMEAIIDKALQKFNGNKTKTASYLGLSRYALHRRLQK